jgi:hypothetical protein
MGVVGGMATESGGEFTLPSFIARCTSFFRELSTRRHGHGHVMGVEKSDNSDFS